MSENTVTSAPAGSSATVQGGLCSTDPHGRAQTPGGRTRPLDERGPQRPARRAGTRPRAPGCGPGAPRAALRDAGFDAVADTDVAFDVEFGSVDDAVCAQLPAGPVAAGVRHSGRAAVVEALRSFFQPRSAVDGTVRMGVVFRCYVANRGR